MIEHLLACKGIVRNTPREFHNVMHALQLQGAPQVFGRGFGGELYAAAGPLQNNNAAPAVAGVLAFLEQRLAQVSGADETAPSPAPAAAARAYVAPATAYRRQSLGGVNAPPRTGGAAGSKKRKRVVAQYPDGTLEPPPARRGRPPRLKIEPTALAALETSSAAAPAVAVAAWRVLTRTMADEFICKAVSRGWCKARAAAEAVVYFRKLGVVLPQAAMETHLEAARQNKQLFLKRMRRSIKQARQFYNAHAEASQGWLPVVPRDLPIVDFRRQYLGLKPAVAAGTAVILKSRRAAPRSLVESLEEALTLGRRPIPARYLREVYDFMAKHKLANKAAAAILRQEHSETGITYSPTWCLRAVATYDLAVVQELRRLIEGMNSMYVIHDGGRVPRVAVKGLLNEFVPVRHRSGAASPPSARRRGRGS